jgi:hypothetical protein
MPQLAGTTLPLRAEPSPALLEHFSHIGAGQAGPSPRGWGEPEEIQVVALGDRTIPTRVGRTPPGERHHPAETDHPHAGGENYASAAMSDVVIGPSPRGWGELAARLHRLQGTRTIPTRVGRTGNGASTMTFRTDHPHAGGENPTGGGNAAGDFGPSPRGWGERHGDVTVAAGERTIPTRVGRTRRRISYQLNCPDHPHAGGENARNLIAQDQWDGPSPRGWGERHRRLGNRH